MPHPAPILIAGGGIGGLATALALARAGHPTTVLERAATLGEIGAGIQLAPNAFHALDALGVGDTARAMAVSIDHLRLMDALTAQPIAHIDLGPDFCARFAHPYAVIHRGDLHGVLLRAARDDPRITLRTAAEVLAYDQDERAVRARLADGSHATGTALIAADGLWSRIRAQLVADGAPRVSGHTTYRSVIPADRMPAELRWNAATLWAGPHGHIVHYPLQGGRTFNLVVTRDNAAPAPLGGHPVPATEVAAAFAHLHARARAIIDHGTDWRAWVLCDRAPTARWTEGRVALLGDAAHPMLQYMAQGACMALEDAVCLAQQVARHPGAIATALGAYQDARLLRTTRVQLLSRAMGEHVYHPAGPHAALRTAIMAGKTQAEWRDALAWLYGGPDGSPGAVGPARAGAPAPRPGADTAAAAVPA